MVRGPRGPTEQNKHADGWGPAGQWLGPQLGTDSPHTHPAPLPKGTAVLGPACCPPSPPLCCPPQQKAGVPEKGPRYTCEHLLERGERPSPPLHPREGPPAFYKALGLEAHFPSLSEKCSRLLVFLSGVGCPPQGQQSSLAGPVTLVMQALTPSVNILPARV